MVKYNYIITYHLHKKGYMTEIEKANDTQQIKEEKQSMAKKKSIIPGLSFSWKRATGISSVKRKIAKATGIPTTKQGRRNKVGKILGIK